MNIFVFCDNAKLLVTAISKNHFRTGLKYVSGWDILSLADGRENDNTLTVKALSCYSES